MKKKSLRIILMVLASLVLIGHFAELNYEDMSWSANSSAYMGIIAMLCIIVAMALSIKSSKMQEKP